MPDKVQPSSPCRSVRRELPGMSCLVRRAAATSLGEQGEVWHCSQPVKAWRHSRLAKCAAVCMG